jgi:integrase
VLALRDHYADVPPADPARRDKPLDEYLDRRAAANNLLRCLSAMISWSVPRGWRNDNPCDRVPKLKGGEGYAPWPMRAIEHYSKYGRPHLWYVVAHALYTGQRQADVIGMLKADVHDGEVRVVQEKTRKPLWIPLHRDLRAVQAEMAAATRTAQTPRLSKHLLTNSHGAPWSQDGFRASFQAEMQRRIFGPLKRHQLVFHGLRKSAVVFLLEAGCTTAEVGSITGQSLQMVEHYAEQVNQRKLARAAILKWENADARRENNSDR